MKLTNQQWAEIFKRYAEGDTATELSLEFGVSAQSIRNKVPARNTPAVRKRAYQLTDAECDRVRELYAAGETRADLAARFNVGDSTISRVVDRKQKPRKRP